MSFRFPLFLALTIILSACSHLIAPGDSAATEPLEGTYWKLVQLDGKDVPVYENQREPSLILNAEDHRISGSSGCNLFSGTYDLKGKHIDLGQLAMTRMACAKGMDTEAAFTMALSRVDTWKVIDKRLELYNADGKLLAEFLAQPLQ